jgi:hypothetical protein
MAIFTIKNRYAAEPFVGMYDGQEYVVKDTLAVPDYVAHHLKRQSIIRDNPVTGDNDYRLAILELDGEPEPVTELPIETLDRSDMDMPKTVLRQTGIRHAQPMRKATFGSLDIAESAKER